MRRKYEVQRSVSYVANAFPQLVTPLGFLPDREQQPIGRQVERGVTHGFQVISRSARYALGHVPTSQRPMPAHRKKQNFPPHHG